jgi:hypothetical protein
MPPLGLQRERVDPFLNSLRPLKKRTDRSGSTRVTGGASRPLLPLIPIAPGFEPCSVAASYRWLSYPFVPHKIHTTGHQIGLTGHGRPHRSLKLARQAINRPITVECCGTARTCSGVAPSVAEAAANDEEGARPSTYGSAWATGPGRRVRWAATGGA